MFAQAALKVRACTPLECGGRPESGKYAMRAAVFGFLTFSPA
jgi:hypothetical protein